MKNGPSPFRARVTRSVASKPLSVEEPSRAAREQRIRAVRAQCEHHIEQTEQKHASLTEHIARSYEAGALAIEGKPSGFPTLPAFLRPIVRGLALFGDGHEGHDRDRVALSDPESRGYRQF